MEVGDAHVFPGFLTPVLRQLFFLTWLLYRWNVGRFGQGRFGQDVLATDVLATDVLATYSEKMDVLAKIILYVLFM